MNLKIVTESRVKALDELFTQSINYRKSKEFFELLEFINKFPALSPFNAFLIHMQNKGVSLVMSSNKWKGYGRAPKLNARPLIILIPFGPVDFVYDVADTTGKEIPVELINPFYTEGDVPITLLHRLTTNLQRDRINYEEYNMHKASAGYAQSKTKSFKISINANYRASEKFSTIVHELAHVYCGHLGINDASWWLNRDILVDAAREIEAESVSYLVCKRCNLKTQSESYLSTYIKSNEMIPNVSLDTILVVAGYIESMLKSGFKPRSKRTK